MPSVYNRRIVGQRGHLHRAELQTDATNWLLDGTAHPNRVRGDGQEAREYLTHHMSSSTLLSIEAFDHS